MASTLSSDRLNALLPDWQALLQGWAADGSLTAAAQEALMLQGTPGTLQDLVNQWSRGDFSRIPPIVLLSSAEMGGTMGAYAVSTRTIYLNGNWLAGASKDQANAVLTEELGHHLDALLNAVDTPGDEGEYFARLLSGQSISEPEKAALRGQSDGGVVRVDAYSIEVEQAAIDPNAAPQPSPVSPYVFYEDFEKNPWALNSTPIGWSVTNGTVDIGNINSWTGYPNSYDGTVVDLDGSTGKSGRLSLSQFLQAGKTYRLTYSIAGNWRSSEGDYLEVSFGDAKTGYNVAANQLFEQKTLDFTPNSSGSYSIQFQNSGGDNIGVLLDNIGVQETAETQTITPEVLSVALRDGAILLQFSEAVSADQTPASAFTVQTINPTTGAATNQVVTLVAQDATDKKQLILLIKGGIADLNFRVSYTDPAGNQTTGVIQDAAGNDLPTFAKDADTLVLTGSANTSALGNSANNTLIGNDGANTLNGSGGADSMSGGSGGDTYVVDNTADTVTETSTGGTDAVQSSVSCTLAANVETLTLTGTTAINGTGNTANNTLSGNTANNTLDGGTGADSMNGGAGNDAYVVDNAGDMVIESSRTGGTDTVQSSITYTLSTNVENLALTGTGTANGTGNTLNNVLTGNTEANTLNGGAGADQMAGGSGNDTYVVDNTGDVVSEDLGTTNGVETVQSSVSYTISDADVENLTLTGTSNTNATGNSSSNTLVGNSGGNIIVGSTGADILTGLSGADTFRFALADSRLSAMDQIKDLVIGTDKIDGPSAVSAANTKELGKVTALDQAGISAVLISSVFGANQAATFTFVSGTSTRTFLALNDGSAGFSNTSDAVIEITGYSGLLTNLSII